MNRDAWIRVLAASANWNVELAALPNGDEKRMKAMTLLGEIADIIGPDGVAPREKQERLEELEQQMCELLQPAWYVKADD